MGEYQKARPVQNGAVYLLDPDGWVIGWPSRSGAHEDRRPKDWHVARFYTLEDRARGVPEQDLRKASDAGLEIHAWRLREDGSPFWAHVILTALEDEKRRMVGFVLVQADLGDQPMQTPGPGKDPATGWPQEVDATAEQLRDHVRALAIVMDVYAGDMPKGVQAMLSVVVKQLEPLSEAISKRALLARAATTVPSKFDRRKK